MMKRIAPVALALGLLAASCGGSGGIEVSDQWGRTSPKAAENGAFYLTLDNGGEADTLVAASTDACGAVELHTTVMTDGVMKMQMVEGGIDLPADGSVSLEPGGLHVMCIGKQVDFVAGEMIELTLDFAIADSQTIELEIRDE
jgi:copper(I)-binding protein